MKLPNPEQALIPFEKLEGYSLNPNHAEGRHKAVVFQSALDIGVAEADELRGALRQEIAATCAKFHFNGCIELKLAITEREGKAWRKF